MCRDGGGPVLTVGVPCLCLHLPVLGVLPVGKAQGTPELACHPQGSPMSKLLQLDTTWAHEVKISKWSRSCLYQPETGVTPGRQPAPSLKGPPWRKELYPPRLKCGSTWLMPRAAALPSGLRHLAAPSAPGQPHGGPLAAALAPLTTSPSSLTVHIAWLQVTPA